MMPKISPKIKLLLVPILAGIMIAVYGYLLIGNSQPVFSWPDEMANYFFIEHFVQSGNFRFAEPLNAFVGDLIHPRSINIFQHDLVPTGFLGLGLIFGVLGKIIGIADTLMLTPILAVLGAWFFYKLIAGIFGEKVGRLSGFLLLFQPAYFYYANFVMLPNIAFVTFLIASLYFFVEAIEEKNRVQDFFFAGFLFALALIIRPSEFLWLGVLLVFFMVILLRQKKYLKVIISIAPIAAICLVYLFFNRQTYGAFFSTGYQSLAGEGAAAGASGALSIFLPFGFNPSQIIKTSLKYLFLFHWWQWALAFLGAAVAWFYKLNKKIAAYSILGTLISILLIVYYGSWQFSDQFILNIANLGVSYHRYWLPILIFSLPFMALALQTLAELEFKYGKQVFALLVAIVMLLDLRAVYFVGNDNLRMIKRSIVGNIEIRRQILEKTPENSVIITERGDKIIFPERKVVGQFDLNKLESLKNLPAGTPLYLLAYDRQIKLDELSEILSRQGFALVNPQKMPNEFTLYEVK